MGTRESDGALGWKSWRGAIVAIVALAVVVALVGIWLGLNGRHRAGTELRATLQAGNPSAGALWMDPTSQSVWCLVPGQQLPTATGRWDDGIQHGGMESRGTLHFDTDDDATFRSDAGDQMTKLRRGGKFDCP